MGLKFHIFFTGGSTFIPPIGNINLLNKIGWLKL